MFLSQQYRRNQMRIFFVTLTQNFYCRVDAGQIPEILPINHPNQYCCVGPQTASKYWEISGINAIPPSSTTDFPGCTSQNFGMLSKTEMTFENSRSNFYFQKIRFSVIISENLSFPRFTLQSAIREACQRQETRTRSWRRWSFVFFTKLMPVD